MCVFALLFLELRREIDWPTREVDARCHGVVDCESEFAGKKETPAGSRREFRWNNCALVDALSYEDSLPRCDGCVNTDLSVRSGCALG